MMNKLIAPLLTAALMAMIYTVVYIKSSSFNKNHQHIIQQINNLKNINTELHKNLSDVRTGVVKHYTALSTTQRELLELATHFLEDMDTINATNDSILNEMINDLNDAAREKVERIDTYKQKHALLMNSLDYYPHISSEIRNNAANIGLLHIFETIPKTVMFYVLNGEEAQRKKASSNIEFLRRRLTEVIPTETSQRLQLANFLAHSQLILDYSAELRELITIEDKAILSKSIDRLHDTYMNIYTVQRAGAEYYRKWMYTLSVILIGFIAFIMFLLGRSALALAREKEKAQVTLASIGNGVIVVNAEGFVEFANPAAEKLLENSNSEMIGRPVEEVFTIINEDNRLPVENSARRCISDKKAINSDEHTFLVTNNNNEIIIEHSASPIRDKDGVVTGAIMVFDDVTNARHMARKIEWQATHDPLTSLVNRHEFENRISEALILAKQDIKPHTMMYLDLDQFKIVNDTCGHMAGDELLKQVVDIMRQHLRDSDVFARLGGDEFGILLTYCSLKEAEKVAEKILKSFHEYTFSWDGKIFNVGISIGIVPVSKESKNVAEIISTSDVACYAAKEAGRNRIHVYERRDKDLKKRQGELQWVTKITDAIRENRLLLYTQKIIPISNKQLLPLSECKETCDGHCEVLLRLQEKNGNIISPGAFLPAAERYSLMPAIDHWVISHALELFASSCSSRQSTSLLSINISGSTLGEKGIQKFIREATEKYDINPCNICFEITESEAVSSLTQTRTIINELREMGFRFAMDDFGSGMSSLFYLKNLPVDYVKIDGKFILDIVKDDVSRAMVEMINHVSHVMGIKTIAEFVENKEILQVLDEIGIDYVQGYYIHKPSNTSESLACVNQV